jgi:hypothetical protein
MHRITLAIAILGILILLTACGRGPAAPIFTSTAPQAATENATYTYPLAAASTDGTKISYALTTAPTGAALSGDTVTWTPTWKQSRNPNQFTVTATTAAGGSASQSWTVTPNGSIHGTYIDTYWTAQGPVNSPADLSRGSFVAILPKPDGSLQVWPSVGTTQGTFTISDVPAGYYWLSSGNLMYWTNSSTFDFGEDLIGSDSTSESFGNFAFNLSGLDPWTASDNLTLFSPNIRQSTSLTDYCCAVICSSSGCTPVSDTPTNGSTTFAIDEQLNFDPSSGNSNYLLQYDAVSTPLTGTVLGPALNLSSYTLDPSTTINVAGALSSSSMSSLDIVFKGSAWAQMYAQQAPGSASETISSVDLSSQPFVTDRAARNPLPITFIDDSGTTAGARAAIPLVSLTLYPPLIDQDFGAVQYNNPFPATWLTLFSASGGSCIPVNSGGEFSLGDLDDYCAMVSYSTTSLPTSTTAIAPPLSPVQNPVLNGTSLFTVGTTATSTPTLSWNPPTGLTPIGYGVYIIQLPSPSAPMGVPLASVVEQLFTEQTSLTVPPGILSPGSTYLFIIEAIADARANLLSSPRRSGYPTAYAQAMSGPVAIGGGSSIPAVSGKGAMSVHPQSQAPGRSKSGSQRQYLFLDREGNLHTVSK